MAKVFVNGLISQEIPHTVPDYILGKLSIKVEDLKQFLQENEKYAIDGWLNATILRSKSSGKRYIELDLWKYNKLHGEDESDPSIQEEIKNLVQKKEPEVVPEIPF